MNELHFFDFFFTVKTFNVLFEFGKEDIAYSYGTSCACNLSAFLSLGESSDAFFQCRFDALRDFGLFGTHAGSELSSTREQLAQSLICSYLCLSGAYVSKLLINECRILRTDAWAG